MQYHDSYEKVSGESRQQTIITEFLPQRGDSYLISFIFTK